MGAFPVQRSKKYEWITAHLHYLGFAVLALMMIQGLVATQRAEHAFKESVQQQEALRNVLWVNLLAQRATVLSLSARVTGDATAYQRAADIAESIPNYLPNSPLLSKVEAILSQIRALPDRRAERRLLAETDKLGTELNSDESLKWYALIAKNDRILHDQRVLMEGFFGYVSVYICFFGWVTSRKRKAEVSLRKSELDKQAAEKANHAKSLFLANMSHELRTPMHGILSFSRFGLRDGRKLDQPQITSHFQEILDSGTHLMTLLNDLLDLSKLEAGKVAYVFQQTDLAPICDRVISEMSAFAAERSVRVTMRAPNHEALSGCLDEGRLSQVFRNLLSNAIKFADASSEITIELKNSGELLRCRVANRGKGIPPNELESIFDKFVQSSKTRTGAGGTGLGLAICREIISAHGGRIWAANEPGGLTSFTFELPQQRVAATA